MKSTKQSAWEAKAALQKFRFFPKLPFFHILVCIGIASGLATSTLRASNILVNPSFELNSGHTVPIGWTYFSPPPPPGYFGDYWVESNVKARSGTFYWKEWGALYLTTVSNVAGIYQDFSSAPGATYNASGWFYTAANDILRPDCYVWVEVDFLGANTNLLALYKSDKFYASVGTGAWFQYQVTNACDLSQPVLTGDPYFTTYAPTGAVTQLVAPAGTTKVRYRFAYFQAGNEGGSCYLDGAVLNQVSGPVPPVVTGISPLNMIFANPNDGLTFNVSSAAGLTINNNAIGLVLNGINLSTNLQITGSSSNKTVAYNGLLSNLTYTASITVTDSFGSTASANSYFGTTWVGIRPLSTYGRQRILISTAGCISTLPVFAQTPEAPIVTLGLLVSSTSTSMEAPVPVTFTALMMRSEPRFPETTIERTTSWPAHWITESIPSSVENGSIIRGTGLLELTG